MRLPRPDLPRSELWVAALLFAVGALVGALAAAMIVTYHDGASLGGLSNANRLQYDTAWIIFLDGVSLVMFALARRRIAKLFAIAAALISLVRIAAYFFPGTIAIQPLLADPWSIHAPGEYAAMATATAIVALIQSAALVFFLPASQRTAWQSVSVATLAAIGLALSLLIAFGSLSGSILVEQSLHLTGDERTSSLFFILLGVTLLIYALAGSEDERLALGRFAPAIVGLAVFACVLVLWRAALNQETRYIHHGTELVASAASTTIDRDLRARIDILERLGERMAFQPFSADIWQREGVSILGDVNEYQSLAWSGPDYVIKWVTPPSDALGFNIRSDPKRQPAVDLAVETREPAISRFTKLLIGGTGVVVYVPVYQDNQYKGMVSGVLGRKEWLRSLLDKRYPDHQFELLEDEQIQQLVTVAGPTAGPEWIREVPIAIRNARWVLRVTPSLDYVTRARSLFPETGLAVGTALAGLLALATFLFQSVRRRARALYRTNAQLEQDIARRLRAEQQLRESEQRIQLIINAIKDCAIYMLDVEGRVASWTRGAEILNGYRAEEILGRHFSVLYPPDRAVPSGQELEVATTRGWFEEECWHLRKDGTRYCGDDIISSIRDEESQLRGFAVVTRDATLRIEARQQTERARDHYLSLFSSFPNLVWRSDPKGECDYVNQAWLDHTGRSMDDQRNSGWLDSVHEEDREAWHSTIAGVFPNRQPFELEFRLRRHDGTYGSMICNGRPYYDVKGDFTGYLCSCYDNTARRATETALKESEERYQLIATNVPGMVFTLERGTDQALRFGYVSGGSVAVTGLEPSAIVADGESFFRLLTPADRAAVSATLDDSAARMATWNWAGRLQPAHEAMEKWISIRAKPRVSGEATVLWEGVVFDDTQNRLAQLEIERSREESRSLSRHLQTIREEEKARIAREVHDELGSTLTGLRIDLDWLLEHPLAPAEDAKRKHTAMLTLLKAAVSATRKIVTDLRPSILDDLGLASALRWQVGEYQKHGALHFNLRTPDPEPTIDRERALVLFRIFQETITNVTRYAKATDVDIDLSETADAYVLLIRDNGMGIAEADLSKPTSHGIRGMRERAAQVGGSLAVHGEPGDGTTVTATVPKPANSA